MKAAAFAFALAALPLTGCVASIKPVDEAGFYTKQVTAAGLPIRSSAQVDDAALLAARDMVRGMLSQRPDLAAEMQRQDIRVAVMGRQEALLDLPEFAAWTKPDTDDPRLTRCERLHYAERIGSLTDRQYWDARVRGIGGERTVVAEEDVLGLRESRYYGETILVHEFGHSVLYAIQAIDPALYRQLEAAYADAEAQGLWRDEYAMTTIHEYWAEGTQFWFDSNKLVVVDGRQILDHRDLQAYDPALYAVLAKVYPDTHRLESDPFYLHPARVPDGPIPENTAEVC
ncbi:glycoside hydrolase [Aurantiacibacter rhizosphaerae]|uniref:glycoside hydrolase n=1 Tax=Aurantiacibacter rhizosphaerae TaxID=2691582 RepID=UPI001F1E768B|nr:glycoside hydrolase [Aurantiacibacter rhizosphaerae]